MVGAVVVVLVLEIIGQGRYPKRSVLMNFIQYANDPTVSGLRHFSFLFLTSVNASVRFLQSVANEAGASHSFKDFVF